jgi:hypothetical protein
MALNGFQEISSDSPHGVVVVNSGSLLDEGVVCLISSESSLDVSTVNTVNFENEDVLVNDIISKNPEVVVMGQSGSIKIEKIYKMLTSFSNMAKLRMIIFHSNDNAVDIFSQQQLNSMRSDNFIQLVQGI